MPCDNATHAHNHVPWPQANAQLKIHSCERTCGYCPKECTRASHLRRHVHSNHLNQSQATRRFSAKPGVRIAGYDGTVVEKDRKKKREAQRSTKGIYGPVGPVRRGRPRKNRTGLATASTPTPEISPPHPIIDEMESVESTAENETIDAQTVEAGTDGSMSFTSVSNIIRASSAWNNLSELDPGIDVVDLTGDDKESRIKVDGIIPFATSVSHALPITSHAADQAEDRMHLTSILDSMRPSIRDTDMTEEAHRVKGLAMNSTLSSGSATITREAIYGATQSQPVEGPIIQDLEMLSDAAFEREGRRIELSIELARLEERRLRYEEERERRAAIRS